MRALVVYESMFGNTAQVAEAVAKGLVEGLDDGTGAGHDVRLLSVERAPAPLVEPVDLLVVGGPTHAFSMSRPNTRADAVRQGAPSVSRDSNGIREWIDGLDPGRHAEAVATFDTRAAKARHLPGSAAKGAAKALRRKGFAPTVRPVSFWVADVAGPLLDGELDRARAWGVELASALPRPESRAPA